uniref:EIF-2-alpha kinase GCN2-like n=1 Tax=Crassostrea virginica TaxID=6565 RepID=A0A8B8ATP0_CRAVI|nr:eIF-2-alpha kinase GCN2-like [Crassostrea virginica]
MESATKNNLVGYCFSEEDLWEIQPSDMREDDTSDESSDKDLHVIEDCLDDEYIKNHFMDIRNIGAGGFGSVYSAKHRIDNKSYALKVIPINMEKFDKREVEVLSSLDHKNIIRYYTCMIIKFRKSIIYPKLSSEEDASDGISFGDGYSGSCNNNATDEKESVKSSSTCGSEEEEILDGCLVIQTELCNTGTNLKTLIDAEYIFSMEENKRRNIILDVIWGLQHIHDQGFMHRDLKPPNIFIGQDDRAKIGDFGFARNYIVPVTNETDGSSPTSKKAGVCFSKNLGTTLYVAPEVRDATSYDRRADLYSLGMIIFEMFHKMNSGMERIKTLEELRKPNFEDLSKIPEKYQNVRRIVESLLNHEPSMRMELESVIALLTSPLGHQKSVEKARIVAQPVTSPDKEYPGPASSIQDVEEAQISEQINTMPEEKRDPPFDFKDMKDSVKIHLNKNMHPDKED